MIAWLSSPDHTLFVGRGEFATPKDGFWEVSGERISESKKSVPVAAPIDVVKGSTRAHVEQSPTVHVDAGRPYGELIWSIALQYACRSSTGSSRGANRCRNVDCRDGKSDRFHFRLASHLRPSKSSNQFEDEQGLYTQFTLEWLVLWPPTFHTSYLRNHIQCSSTLVENANKSGSGGSLETA